MLPHEQFLVNLWKRNDYIDPDRARAIYGYMSAAIDYLEPRDRAEILSDLNTIHTLLSFKGSYLNSL